jgi:hypothetical protein
VGEEARDLYTPDFLEAIAYSNEWRLKALLLLLDFTGNISSYLDIGCGDGYPSKVLSAKIECTGIDLALPVELYSPKLTLMKRDLSTPINLGRKFDLVSSLEVGEHLHKSAANTFVDSIVSHVDRWLWFSAAIPGQGGYYHINEQPHTYWIDKFTRRGLRYLDACTAIFRDLLNEEVVGPCWWYRQNSVLFMKG